MDQEQKTEIIEEKKYLTKFNVFSFSVAGFGQNLIYSFINTYLLYFYTDVFLIPVSAVTVLMLIARVFDALNDPLMGNIVDMTRTKMGKMRPYLLISIVPLGIITVLLFLAPDLSTTGKIVYAYITYIMLDLIYTLCDVPFWGLASAMTPNTKERHSFISFARIFHMIGSALPVVLLPAYIWLTKGQSSLKTSYLTLAIFCGVIGMVTFAFSFFGTKERVSTSVKSPSMKENLKYFLQNRPLQQVVLANVVGFLRAVPVVGGMYISTYLLGDAGMNMFIMGAWGVFGFIGVFFCPILAKKWNYKQVFFIFSIWGAVVCAIFSILGFVIGYQNIVFYIIYLALMGFPYGIITNNNYAMIAESVDYVEWKTGKRTEGVSLSLQTLMNKMMTALQNAVVPFMLGIFAFIQPISVNGESMIQTQSKHTLDGIFMIATVLPMAGYILSLIPMFFYKFVGKERKRIYEELNAKRENAIVD